jgi:hypothetical protein
MWSDDTFQAVAELTRLGLSDYEIARRTGVPRTTVMRWRQHPIRRRLLPPPVARHWRPPDGRAYCYLLGLYLGDGHITSPRGKTPCLRLSLDERYEGIIKSGQEAIQRTAESVVVRRYPSGSGGAVIVHATHPVWPRAFPQHGPGRKHLRTIRLEPWQRRLTKRHPAQLLRGLIHSDGARTINRFSVALPSGRVGKYGYVRYFFSNVSADIRAIFCDHCELLGIRWTQSNHRNISISHRESVAILESFVGPKA